MRLLGVRGAGKLRIRAETRQTQGETELVRILLVAGLSTRRDACEVRWEVGGGRRPWYKICTDTHTWTAPLRYRYLHIIFTRLVRAQSRDF